MMSKLKSYRHMADVIGVVPAALNKVQRMRLRRLPPRSTVRLRSKYARFGLECRAGSSDLDVFTQIFYDREYSCIDEIKSADLIIDCGANVGYSAAYLLSRFPEAKLVAVEPDPDNFTILEANVRHFGARATCLCCGVWSHATGLVFTRDSLGAGNEWGRIVRENVDGETPEVQAIDIGGILERSGKQRISILKMDIEGSEAAVFSKNFQSWIDKVDNILIELHGERCEDVFNDAISGRGFQVSHCCELTVCKRRAL